MLMRQTGLLEGIEESRLFRGKRGADGQDSDQCGETGRLNSMNSSAFVKSPRQPLYIYNKRPARTSKWGYNPKR